MAILYEGEYQEMKNRNKKMILVVFLTGILIMSGCAAMKENVSKGYSDHPENDASHLEKEVREKYDQLVQHLIKNNISVTAMESCTAGQIASLLTDTSGSSAIMKGAFVTYSNEAKIRAGVSEKTINEYGVYSKETAAEMARVCREYYDADIGIGVTGSFGNVDPKNEDSVPGEVYFAISTREGTESFYCEVPEQPSRLYYKLYMANVIADEIIKTVR
jgi:PncC family amidohydrolase